MSWMLASCSKNDPITDPSARLLFSTDTLRFDTVFTSRGSATRILKAYNPYNRPLIIEQVGIEAQGHNFFRINVDGVPGNQFNPIEVAPNDSMYIFAEVTIDPDMPLSVSPFVIADLLYFYVNGNRQNVVLEAWGQNANYIGSKSGASLLSCQFGTYTFDDPKPYVIYGVLVVDSCTLELPPDTRIYVHGGLGRIDGQFYNDGILYFGQYGKLNSSGTVNQPVIIRGDRLEPEYDEITGQWAGIILGPGSTGHQVKHTTIRNSIVGIRVDSAAVLDIRNSRIHNTQGSNLLALNATIYAENCLFFSSDGGNNVQLEQGGHYTFNYCTMAGFSFVPFIGHSDPVLRMTNFRCLNASCSNIIPSALTTNFTNCVIYGNRLDEILMIDGGEQIPFNYQFSHSVVKIRDLGVGDYFPTFIDDCINCLVNKDPGFEDPVEMNYRPDSTSVLFESALPISSIMVDIDEQPRNSLSPTIGAYEF